MKYIIKLVVACLPVWICSCGDFLDEKNDKSLTVPNRLSDLEALLNHANSMNTEYVASLGEVASDNLHLTDNAWGAILADEDRGAYIWEPIPVKDKFWPYGRILNCNVVLQQIETMKEGSQEERNHIRGSALFYRGIAFFDLLQIYARSYEDELADDEPGIVLRVTGDIDEELNWASQEQSMKQIEGDLLHAATLLNDASPRYPTQASKTAVYGVLARYYLMKKEYGKALEFADKVLAKNDKLMNYNLISSGKYPFERYNKEVLFFSMSDGTGVLSESRARVHPDLYEMYTDTDRRKEIFFTKNADGFYAFSGDYSRNTSSYKFCGLTTAEILLTRAECRVRVGNMEGAIEDMQKFFEHRYAEKPTLQSDMNYGELLRIILDERRKELVFRGMRWFDLRRLTQEESGVDRIVKVVDGQTYSKSLEEIKAFRYLVPQSVIDQTEIIP